MVEPLNQHGRHDSTLDALEQEALDLERDIVVDENESIHLTRAVLLLVRTAIQIWRVS